MWNDILTEIYLLLRDCSMHLFLPSEFVINSLQLIQHSSTLSLPAKCEIQKDIHDIVFQEKDDRVVDPSLLNPLSANSASMDNTSGAEPLLFLKAPLSITDIEQFFRVKFNFTKKLIYVQETTEFELEVTSFFPAEFALTELSTEFSNSFVVSKHCDGDDDTLKFLPNVPKEFTFQITPSASGPLKVSSISMTIGQGRSKVSFVYTPDYKSPTMAGSSCSSENKDILM